jgi:hypothetical protein
VTHVLLATQAVLEWKELVWRRHTVTGSNVMTLMSVMMARMEAAPQTPFAIMLRYLLGSKNCGK